MIEEEGGVSGSVFNDIDSRVRHTAKTGSVKRWRVFLDQMPLLLPYGAQNQSPIDNPISIA
jgi:hypothetical protein